MRSQTLKTTTPGRYLHHMSIVTYFSTNFLDGLVEIFFQHPDSHLLIGKQQKYDHGYSVPMKRAGAVRTCAFIDHEQSRASTYPKRGESIIPNSHVAFWSVLMAVERVFDIDSEENTVTGSAEYWLLARAVARQTSAVLTT